MSKYQDIRLEILYFGTSNIRMIDHYHQGELMVSCWIWKKKFNYVVELIQLYVSMKSSNTLNCHLLFQCYMPSLNLAAGQLLQHIHWKIKP